MTFNKIVAKRIDKIQATLARKEKEYAADNDRFHNFRVAARIADTTPERALHGMMLKHEVSAMDLIEWADRCPERLTEALIDEKIGDFINYLILLEGLLTERVNKRQNN